MADKVTIVEVGPRDGLQNEPAPVATKDKIRLIALLSQSGLTRIEATAFVSPKWVPQMADHSAVMAGIARHQGTSYAALVPNEQGALAAVKAGADELAFFTAASDTFARRNMNCTIDEAFDRAMPVVALAKAHGKRLRAYLSCCWRCPFEGAISPTIIAPLAERLRAMGADEIVLSDTIGRGTADETEHLLAAILPRVSPDHLALHCHDTAGRAVDNITVGYAHGIRTFDAAIGGLGGCPYAPGAAGNVDTLRLHDFFIAKGIQTGLERSDLTEAARFIRQIVGSRL